MAVVALTVLVMTVEETSLDENRDWEIQRIDSHRVYILSQLLNDGRPPIVLMISNLQTIDSGQKRWRL